MPSFVAKTVALDLRQAQPKKGNKSPGNPRKCFSE